MRLASIAGVCALGFVILGLWVTHHGLSRIDVESVALRGRGVPLAIAFTNSGYGLALTVIGLASIGAAMVMRLPVKVPLAILVSQFVSQGVVSVVKGVFARARPDAWLYRHEAGFSYPSGHATTAIVFYGAWLWVLWCAPVPPAARAVGVVLLALWIAGIGWSRVALGAHYPTDVVGGYLFGTAWLCAFVALAGVIDAGVSARFS